VVSQDLIPFFAKLACENISKLWSFAFKSTRKVKIIYQKIWIVAKVFKNVRFHVNNKTEVFS